MSYKHITVQVQPIPPLFTEVVLRITYQTHHGDTFGNNKSLFIAKNGVELCSTDYPHLVHNPVTKRLYVRGRTTEYDETTITLKNNKLYRQIIEAIQEYNQVFSTPSSEKPNTEGWYNID